jgi:hypothetical protein
MSVINCYYIEDGISLWELVSVSDTGGLNVKYLQISYTLPQYKLWVHSQHFAYRVLNVNDFDWNKRLSEASGHFKYVQLFPYTQIEMVASNNAWEAPST